MAVADIDVAGGVHSDSQWYVELAGSLAEFAPFCQEFAFGGELLNAVIVAPCLSYGAALTAILQLSVDFPRPRRA